MYPLLESTEKWVGLSCPLRHYGTTEEVVCVNDNPTVQLYVLVELENLPKFDRFVHHVIGGKRIGMVNIHPDGEIRWMVSRNEVEYNAHSAGDAIRMLIPELG